MFDLKRPCMNCPFRKGQGELFGLRNLDDIFAAPAFQCHKTVDYSIGDKGRPGDNPQQCAGLMAILHREGKPNQIMQVGERLDRFDPEQLDPDGEAYMSMTEARKAHERG